MQVSVRSNAKEVLKDYKLLSKSIKDKAMLHALNYTGARADVELRRRIVKESGLQAKYVKRKMGKYKANRMRLIYTLAASTRDAINLVEWVTKSEQNKWLQRKRYKSGKLKSLPAGVTAGAWRNKKQYKNTFVIEGKNSGKPVVVSARKRGYRGRRWSKTIYGPVAWRQFYFYSEEEALKAVDKYFAKEFRRQIARLREAR